jgi:superfamily I DNA and/or RNA helicase
MADAGKQAELHVSLVVVDEAAQATEVDALKAIAFVRKRTRVLLAGDHMQLGPVIISRRASELQFQVSLMQRLVALEAYRQPGMCSALNVNYRSHPALVAVPSFIFYANSICCAPQSHPDEKEKLQDIGRLLGEWQGLPRRDFPLMFYGVAGVDSSPDGHGVRNSVEAKTCLFLASKLLEDMPWLSQSDIGVMAPFRLQVVLFC